MFFCNVRTPQSRRASLTSQEVREKRAFQFRWPRVFAYRLRINNPARENERSASSQPEASIQVSVAR